MHGASAAPVEALAFNSVKPCWIPLVPRHAQGKGGTQEGQQQQPTQLHAGSGCVLTGSG